jgi:hypothetical protein
MHLAGNFRVGTRCRQERRTLGRGQFGRAQEYLIDHLLAFTGHAAVDPLIPVRRKTAPVFSDPSVNPAKMF